jgi:hypothetical protein
MRFPMILGLVVALFTPFAAHAFDDPRALVDAIYAPYKSGQTHGDLSQFYSARLNQLLLEHSSNAAAEVDTAAAEPLAVNPAIDFNPFIDGQHALLMDVAVGAPVVVGDKALVTVGFHNFDQPTLLSLALVREADGWKVDDVTSTGGDENWMLSWLLQYDPWGGM